MRWTTIVLMLVLSLFAVIVCLSSRQIERDQETIRRNLEQSRELNNESLKNIERRGF